MNSVVMNQEKTRNNMVDWVQKGCIFFTGAGISVSPPSSIPMANQIKNLIINILQDNLYCEEEKVDRVRNCLDSLFQVIKMETLFEVFIRNGKNDIFNCLKVIQNSKPNQDHFLIANLCKMKWVRAIFTLNYDYLHELSLEALKIPYKPLLTDKDFVGFHLPNNDSFIPVFHLHNGFSPDNFNDIKHLNAATSNVRSHLPYEKAVIFSEYLKSNTIFCAGYSNNDIDTFQLIEEYATKIIWYSHSPNNNLPSRVAEVLKIMGNDLLLISRDQKNNQEKYFSDVLKNSFGTEIDDLTYKDVSAINRKSLSLNEKLDYMQNKIIKFLDQPLMATLITADLLDICNERELALELLVDPNWKNLKIKIPNDMQFYRSKILAHLYDRIGKPKLSLNYSKKTIELSSDSKKTFFRLFYMSALFGVWKRNPFNILNFLRYSAERWRIRREINTDPDVLNRDEKQNYFFELGDYYDFIGSYLFFPSVIFLKLKNLFQPSVKLNTLDKYFYSKFLKFLDQIIILIGGWLFNSLLNKALFYYNKVANNIELNRGYAYLCACRCVEILCFQKRFEEAKQYTQTLNDGLLYFDFSNEIHGKGNILLAYYVLWNGIDKNNSEINKDYYEKAYESYKSHFSGRFKLSVMRFRVENSIYL